MFDHASVSKHACSRARHRGIPDAAIDAAIEFGQYRSRRGADIYTIGWRNVRYWQMRGVDLSRWLGIEVVCSRSGLVVTVYRNHNPAAMRDRRPRDAA